MAKLEQAEWWSIRRARSSRPATYRCPLCGYRLHAMSPHVLIAPEGDTSRRRHAHTECVLTARTRGELPLREEWLQGRPRPDPLWRRLLGRGRGQTN